jgi:hypothetical protein
MNTTRFGSSDEEQNKISGMLCEVKVPKWAFSHYPPFNEVRHEIQQNMRIPYFVLEIPATEYSGTFSTNYEEYAIIGLSHLLGLLKAEYQLDRIKMGDMSSLD